MFRGGIVFVNSRSGWKSAHQLYAQTLEVPLSKQCIPVELFLIPPKEPKLEVRRRLGTERRTDFIVVSGGDGSVSTIAATLRDLGAQIPMLVVPSGIQNSISHGLGIHSTDDSLLAWNAANIIEVPLWECVVRDPDQNIIRADNRGATMMCFSGVSAGLYGETLRNSRQLQLWTAQAVAIPQLKHRFTWCFMWNVLRRKPFGPCAITITQADGTATEVFRGPLRMCLASRTPTQHSKLHLTPSASVASTTLSLLVVDDTATRARELHLFMREAREGSILEEDGVRIYECRSFSIQALDQPLPVLVDGETFVLGPNISLSVEPREGTQKFFSLSV